MQSPDPQAQQWQSDLLAQLRGASRPNEAAQPGEQRGAPDESAYRAAPHLTAVAQRPRTLHRALSHRPATSRMGRYVSLSKTLIGGNGVSTDHTDTMARLQTPVPTGRRVVVAGAHGGAGATTVALLIADAFHVYRPDGVVLLDAAGNAGGLLSRLSQAPTTSVAGADTYLGAGRIEAVVKSQHPAWVVLTPAAEGHVAARVAARLQRRVGLTLIDVGVQTHDVPAHDALAHNALAHNALAHNALAHDADAAVLVCENTVRGLLCVTAAVEDCLANGLVGASIVVVIVERVHDSGLTLNQARREVQKSHRVAVAHVPRDRHLAGGAHVHSHLLATRTRHALNVVAAAVIESSVTG